MRTAKVVNRNDVLKEHERILRPLEARVKGIVVNILGDVQANLGAELHGIALEVMRAVMELEISGIAGPKGKHLDHRIYSRWGTNPGSVIVDGIKVGCDVPRAVEQGRLKGYVLKTYQHFRQRSELVKRAYRDLIRGISAHRFAEGVEAFVKGHGISASTISRHMIQATAQKVEELFSRSLEGLKLAVLMIDGVKVGGHTVVIALGIDNKGFKHVLGLRQGATENTAVVKGLLEELVDRSLETDPMMLIVIDGAKALRKAVSEVFGEEAPVQRCTVHKRRNVLEHLSKRDQPWVSRRMTEAYALHDEAKAQRELLQLADQLEKLNPSAAKSLREGLEETLTVLRLGLPEQLRRSLRSTNIIESANNGIRDRSRNVKRWRDGMQIERWTAASLLEIEKKFRRIRGCNHMPVLIAALENYQKKETEAA
jgi:transposase-like protein